MLLLVCLLLVADEPPANVARLIAASDAKKKASIAKLTDSIAPAAMKARADERRKKIDALKAKVTATLAQFANEPPAKRNQRVADLRKEIADLSNVKSQRLADDAFVAETKEKIDRLQTKAIVAGNLPQAMNVGDIGVLPYAAKIQQILGPKEMLVNTRWAVRRVRIENNRPVPFDELQTVLVLLRNVPTGTLSDEFAVALPYAFEVTGNHTYTTALGASNTVMVLEPFDLEAAEKWVK